MKNKDLKKFYNRVYARGESHHYTKLRHAQGSLSMDKMAVLKELAWKGKTVLDVGCGTGETAYHIAQRGALRVVGLDYSAQAIAVARKTYQHTNLSFEKRDIKEVKEKFDVIITMGTLEHIDNPLALLKKFKIMLTPGGSLIVTSPNWSNPRGYMLLTLWFLFRARITLADLHYFTPLEFEKWARALKLKLKWRTVDQEWSHGEKLVRDFTRRLPNVARDSRLSTTAARIRSFIAWIESHILPLEKDGVHTGAIGVYHFRLGKR